MTFENPVFLRIGAGLVLLAALGLWSHTRRRRALAAFMGGRRGAGRVSRSDLYRPPVERMLLLGLAALAVAGAAAGPRLVVAEVTPPPPPPARSVVIAIDVSASMQAADASPTRLARAMEVAAGLVDGLERERVGLLLFAGTPYPLVPPTHDHAALRYIMAGVTPTIASAHDPGSLPGDGIAAAAVLVAENAEPDGELAIVLIGDGGGGEAAAAEAAREAREAGVTLHAIGVGTEEGARMVMPEAPYQLRSLIVDSAGVPVVSRLREAPLRRVAEAGGGTYAPAGDESALRELVDALAAPAAAPPPAQEAPLWSRFDLTFLLAAAALLLLLLESLMDVRLPTRAPAAVRRPA